MTTPSDQVFVREPNSYTIDPALEQLLRKVRRGYAPPTDLSVSDYADSAIVLTSGPLAGTKWQTDFAPYQRGIMDGYHEPGVEIIVVMGSSQWGKTSILVNLVAYHIEHDPCPILIVEPTLDPMARDFARNRLEPVIAASPTLLERVSKKRSKDASNTTLSKTYTGGQLAIAGANSASSLASRPIRFLGLDEIDRYPQELPGEGNTISVAIKRTQTYRRRRRIFLTSSPTMVNAPIHSWFKRGDQRRYFVPCPDCGCMHAYEWKNIKWDDHDPQTARLECPACEFRIDDGTRVALLAKGEWRATAAERPDRSIISFHLWEAYSPMSSLADIVASFLRAREVQKTGDKSEMHTWQNTTLGEPIEHNASEGIKSHQLLDRREDVELEIDVPAGACCLTMGVDTQDDRLEALVWGWGPGEESWLIDRHVFPGDPNGPEPWAQLDGLLDTQYVHESGQRLAVAATCIDTAGHRTSMVYDFASRRAARRVYAIIGREGQRPIVSSPSQRRWGKGQREVALYTVGVDAAKSMFLDRLARTEKGPGYVHLPKTDWCDAELAEQFTSEAIETKWERGLPKQVWKKLRNRNEGLDMSVYAIAALRLLNPKLSAMADALRNSGPRQTAAPLRPTQRRRRSHSNFLKR